MAQTDDTSSLRPSRRQMLRFGVGAGVMLAVGVSIVRTVTAPAETGALITPQEAFELASAKSAHLIDIRRPDEWQRTGVGLGAQPLDMRRDDFTSALADLVGKDRNQPIILICAGGVRSKHMAKRLAEAGFTRIIDVPEGMLGSRAGPGWVRRGLPVTPYTAG